MTNRAGTAAALGTLLGAVVLTGCSGTDARPVADRYSGFPARCFTGVEDALRRVVGPLYSQRRDDLTHGVPQRPVSTMASCAVAFSSTTPPGKGQPVNRLVSVSYLLFGKDTSVHTPDTEARGIYDRVVGHAAGERHRQALREQSESWFSSADPVGGHAVFRDHNLVVEVTVNGTDASTGADAPTPMPPAAAEAAAVALASAIAVDPVPAH